jgi:plastocyanin
MRRAILATLVLAVAAGTIVAADQKTVTQKGKAFSTPEIRVKVGDEVVFKNDDDATHNVFSTTKGQEFNLKVQLPGSTSTQVFKIEGVAEVQCAFHPQMKLKITVTK